MSVRLACLSSARRSGEGVGQVAQPADHQRQVVLGDIVQVVWRRCAAVLARIIEQR